MKETNVEERMMWLRYELDRVKECEPISQVAKSNNLVRTKSDGRNGQDQEHQKRIVTAQIEKEDKRTNPACPDVQRPG